MKGKTKNLLKMFQIRKKNIRLLSQLEKNSIYNYKPTIHYFQKTYILRTNSIRINYKKKKRIRRNSPTFEKKCKMHICLLISLLCNALALSHFIRVTRKLSIAISEAI